MEGLRNMLDSIFRGENGERSGYDGLIRPYRLGVQLSYLGAGGMRMERTTAQERNMPHTVTQ